MPGTQVMNDSKIKQRAQFPQHIFGARERPAEVERQGAVRQIGRDGAGSDESGEEKRQAALDAQESEEEVAVDVEDFVVAGRA